VNHTFKWSVFKSFYYFTVLCTLLSGTGINHFITSNVPQEEDSFSSQLNLKLRSILVMWDIWIIALYGAENWTLRKVNQKSLEGCEM
jgi:hypothetical protein